MKKIGNLFLVCLLSGATTLGAYKIFFDEGNINKQGITTVAPQQLTRNVNLGAENIDFTGAAEATIHSVVHVKNVSYRTVSNPMLEYYYGYKGGQQQEQVGTGSGVIISADGYIVTNNHVVKDASDLEITLNDNRTYKAKLVGTDSKMDIALLKIDSDGKLPYITFANSDSVKVGEWVLAVGNPYNLNSTVTAGIVSAKARNLDTKSIQSFIQTDAAVNPGNSGGALVNTRGELIGINTMISSMTGSYVGYSFAVPSNIARKIIEDIMEFGNVQRGILGVEGGELNTAVSKELGVKQIQGFYVSNVKKGTGADIGGIKKGDVIVKLDNIGISSYAELAGYISTKRPDDKITVGIIRNGNNIVVPVSLTKNEFVSTAFKGIEFENLESADMKKFGLKSGVKISSIDNERLTQYSDELTGAVILKIGNIPATDVETVNKILGNISDQQSVQLEVITTNGQRVRLII